MTIKPTISVVGAGRMGRGLAHVFAYAGYRVHLFDPKQRTRSAQHKTQADAFQEITRTLGLMEQLDKTSSINTEEMLSRIFFYHRSQADDAMSTADLIFEAAPEVLEVKKESLELICRYSPSASIIASTTSTMSVDELAQHVSRPSRFLNAHWLNPAFLIPLVELSVGDKTSSHATNTIKILLERIGKVPVVLKSSPGFVVPRIQALAMSEAARALEEGVASAEDKDKALRVVFGMRFAILGLIEFIDWGGDATLYYAGNYLKKSLNSDRFTVPKIAAQNMRDGRNGVREGQGFYNYSDVDIDSYQLETLKKLSDLIQHLGLLAPPGGIKNPKDTPASRSQHPHLHSNKT